MLKDALLREGELVEKEIELLKNDKVANEELNVIKANEKIKGRKYDKISMTAKLIYY